MNWEYPPNLVKVADLHFELLPMPAERSALVSWLQNEEHVSGFKRQFLHHISSVQKDWWFWLIHFKIHVRDIFCLSNGNNIRVIVINYKWEKSAENFFEITLHLLADLWTLGATSVKLKWQMTRTTYLHDTRWCKIKSQKCSQDGKGGAGRGRSVLPLLEKNTIF